MNNYLKIKTIKKNRKKEISIIKISNKKYIYKKTYNKDINILMLKNEEKIIKLLEKNNIAPRIYKSNFSKMNNYLIIEFIEGKQINKINFNNNIEIIELILKIISSLKILHNNKIIHCDLKPDNILLNTSNKIIILDYEIAKTNDNYLFGGFGTAEYSSKDQLLKNEIDYTTDIYSVGIIFYELLMGELPFGKEKKEIKDNKLKDNFKKTNNLLLDLIFTNIFTATEKKYKTLDELEKDIKLLLLR